MMCQCSGQLATSASFGFLRSREICTPSDSSYEPCCHLSPADISSTIPLTLQSCGSILNSLTLIHSDMGYILLWELYTGESLCFVAAVLHYLTIRCVEAGPIFRFSDGRALTRRRFGSSICQALSDLGHFPV